MSQLFTLEEIKPNNGKDGAKTWIVLHDNVYDVTDYLKDVSDAHRSICVNEKNIDFFLFWNLFLFKASWRW